MPFILFIYRPKSYGLCIAMFFCPLFPILFDKFWSGINEAYFGFYLTYLAYRLPVDALIGFAAGMSAVIPLQKFWPKVESKQWSGILAYTLLFGAMALGTVASRELVGLWFNPEGVLPTGEPLRQYRWLSNQFVSVLASIYFALGWQRARLPQSIKDKLNFDEAKPELVKRQVNFYKEVFANSHRRVFDSHESLNEAIFKSEAVRLRPDFAEANEYTQNMATSHIGHLYLKRYERDGSDTDLDHAIDTWQGVLQSAPIRPYELASSLTDLSVGLMARYERDGNLADLDDAIRHLRQSLGLLPEDADLFRMERPLLGMALSMHAKATQNTVESNEAVTLAEASLKAAKLNIASTKQDDEFRRRLKVLIASIFIINHEWANTNDVLTLAIQLLKPIASDLGLAADHRAHVEEYLARCLFDRYRQSGSPFDLHTALKLTTSALALTTEKDARLARRVNLVGKCWHAQYLHSRIASDRENAISHLQRAVEIARATSPYRPRYEQDLQIAFHAE